jgi:hypothetical protein
MHYVQANPRISQIFVDTHFLLQVFECHSLLSRRRVLAIGLTSSRDPSVSLMLDKNRKQLNSDYS